MLNNLRNNHIFWRYLTNFWALISIISVSYDFITENYISEFLGPVLAIYIAILAIYVSDKEFERWYDNHKGKHPGEIFIGVWTILIILILLADIIFDLPYQLPNEVASSYIAVLGILAITKRSKSLYTEKKRKKKKK